jgi:hypothetical protein
MEFRLPCRPYGLQGGGESELLSVHRRFSSLNDLDLKTISENESRKTKIDSISRLEFIKSDMQIQQS